MSLRELGYTATRDGDSLRVRIRDPRTGRFRVVHFDLAGATELAEDLASHAQKYADAARELAEIAREIALERAAAAENSDPAPADGRRPQDGR